MAPQFEVKVDTPSRLEARALLERHLQYNSDNTPICSNHTLGWQELAAPNIQFWTVSDEAGAVIAMGALKDCGGGLGEIKSMHVREDQRGTGIASVMVDHIIEAAKRNGCKTLKLETGSRAGHAPARKLYARHGFTVCGPFADYSHDPESVFMELPLTENL